MGIEDGSGVPYGIDPSVRLTFVGERGTWGLAEGEDADRVQGVEHALPALRSAGTLVR